MRKSIDEKIKAGFLAQKGLLSSADVKSATKLVKALEDSSVETIRLVFTDQHGVLRGKTIVADALASAFAMGLGAPSTLLLKDTSQRTVFPIWTKDAGVGSGLMQGASDLLMVPDPSTFTILPWAPHSAWVMCDTVFHSGEPISFSPRTVLKTALAKLADKGLSMFVGLEVEFSVFELADEDGDNATLNARPLDGAHHFLTEHTYDKHEPLMDELRRTCQEMGLPIRSMEVEMGHGQFEFTFDPDTPLAHADNMIMFRTMVKAVCAREGLHATFMCRPRVEKAASNGWHLHQSILDAKSGKNLFMPNKAGELTPLANNWIAGLLKYAKESCLLTTPTVNGYKRYQQFQMAPDRIQWGIDNRGSMVRGLMKPKDEASRIENRVADTTANPYYFFASQILAGLAGVEGDLKAPPPVETPYDGGQEALPKSLIEAVDAFEKSKLFRRELGDDFVDYLTHIKRAEWERYLMTVSEWEQQEYFHLF
ncbi:MAG: glutamine synthetase family protein [Rhizobiaceae bacterium]